MTVNEFIDALKDTGDEQFRNTAVVKVDGSVDIYDEENDEISRHSFIAEPDAFDIKVGRNCVNICI